jgi:hypothetical protein
LLAPMVILAPSFGTFTTLYSAMFSSCAKIA